MTTANGGRLNGELGFANVKSVLKHASDLVTSGSLDLSGVTRVDSAGLALLLELERRSRAQGRELELEGAHDGIVRLAKFYGLHEILRFRSAV